MQEAVCEKVLISNMKKLLPWSFRVVRKNNIKALKLVIRVF